MPSLTLLGQSVIGGLLIGGLYTLLAFGLSLSWGLLRLVNISYFALAFLSAYLTYQLGTVYNVAPWWSALILVPAFFLLGTAMHWCFVRFGVVELASLVITFSIAVLVEALIQWIWSADFRKYESGYAGMTNHVGPFYIPTLDILALVTAIVLSLATWAWLRFTYVGKALRAAAQDADMAAAFGINHRRLSYVVAGLCAAYSAIAGVFIALISTLAPSEIGTWIGVAFAIVIIGQPGNPIGVLLAGLLIGVSEAMTMAIATPAWAPLVSFSILILLLIWRPRWA
jgi:branched-chain amino acid transport system permease protein